MVHDLNKQIIDTHVHMFPKGLFEAIWDYFEANYWDIHRRVDAALIPSYLAEFGVRNLSALFYAHKRNISRQLNDWMHGLSQKIPSIIPFGTIHPEDKYLKAELDRILSPDGLDFAGIKLQLMVTEFDPDIRELDAMYEKLVEYGKVLVLHVGDGPKPEYCRNESLEISPHVGIAKLKPVLERYPKLKLQIPHLGATEYDAIFELVADNENLRLDTAMMLVPHDTFPSGLERDSMIDDIITLQDHVMFGSDFPNVPYRYQFVVESMYKLPLDSEILEKIMLKNAEKFYSLG